MIHIIAGTEVSPSKHDTMEIKGIFDLNFHTRYTFLSPFVNKQFTFFIYSNIPLILHPCDRIGAVLPNIQDYQTVPILTQVLAGKYVTALVLRLHNQADEYSSLITPSPVGFFYNSVASSQRMCMSVPFHHTNTFTLIGQVTGIRLERTAVNRIHNILSNCANLGCFEKAIHFPFMS